MCKDPPYHVSEVGYAGFELPIDIYFKNKAEPKKIKFMYNLFLHMEEPVNHVRCEKLTFQNPTEEFKKKLLKAGGVCIYIYIYIYQCFDPGTGIGDSPQILKDPPTLI